MKLYIMRHGEASWDAPSDQQRPLTETGQWLSGQVARHLLADKPQQLIVSPYLRAQQTRLAVLDVIGQVPCDTCALITPEGHTAAVIDWLYQYLADRPALTSLMLISHNPFVSDLISVLVDGHKRRGDSALPVMSTSTLVTLQCDVVAAGCCQLIASYHD